METQALYYGYGTSTGSPTARPSAVLMLALSLLLLLPDQVLCELAEGRDSSVCLVAVELCLASNIAPPPTLNSLSECSLKEEAPHHCPRCWLPTCSALCSHCTILALPSQRGKPAPLTQVSWKGGLHERLSTEHAQGKAGGGANHLERAWQASKSLTTGPLGIGPSTAMNSKDS